MNKKFDRPIPELDFAKTSVASVVYRSSNKWK